MKNFQEQMTHLSEKKKELLEKRWSLMKKKEELKKIILPIKQGDLSQYFPLFCTHPPIGVTGYYLNIARHLSEKQPVYGIQCPAFYDLRDPFNRIPEMAAYYIQAMRAIHPEGPYLLMGHSSASYIAYEIARQLQAEGVHIPLLVVVDCEAPCGPEDPIMMAFKKSDLFEDVEALFICAWVVSLAYNDTLPFSVEELIPLSVEERYKKVTAYFQQTGFVPAHADISIVKTVLQMLASHGEADSSYREHFNEKGPTPPLYQGKTLLFRCTEPTRWPGYDIVSEIDESTYLEWDRFCDGSIDVMGIREANHITIIAEPCVSEIAEKLQPYLEEYGHRNG